MIKIKVHEVKTEWPYTIWQITVIPSKWGQPGQSLRVVYDADILYYEHRILDLYHEKDATDKQIHDLISNIFKAKTIRKNI